MRIPHWKLKPRAMAENDLRTSLRATWWRHCSVACWEEGSEVTTGKVCVRCTSWNRLSPSQFSTLCVVCPGLWAPWGCGRLLTQVIPVIRCYFRHNKCVFSGVSWLGASCEMRAEISAMERGVLMMIFICFYNYRKLTIYVKYHEGIALWIQIVLLQNS